jgi:hypothetical protein
MSTILAVPFDKPLILTKEQSRKVLVAVRNKRPRTSDEKKASREKAKTLLGNM